MSKGTKIRPIVVVSPKCLARALGSWCHLVHSALLEAMRLDILPVICLHEGY